MTAAALSTKVQARIGANRLKQMTVDSPTATTFDSTVLEAACEDAIGQFERITGVTHDTTNMSHVAILVKGVMALLESFKGREVGMLANLNKEFIRDCLSFREAVYISPSSTSNLTVDREEDGTRTDMDRKRRVWTNNRQVTRPRETVSTEDDDR